jgi:SAM-dependent methyltransferase
MISEYVKNLPSIRELNIHDISMLDALPHYQCDTILNVGCGPGRIDYYIKKNGWDIYSTDIEEYPQWSELKKNGNKFSISDIYDLDTFPIKDSDVVMCSHVLEHLDDWKTALHNMLKLTKVRLILSFPYKKSYWDGDHKHYWDDIKSPEFNDINEFYTLCSPYAVSVTKQRTKPEDVEVNQYEYMVIVDKRQKYNF